MASLGTVAPPVSNLGEDDQLDQEPVKGGWRPSIYLNGVQVVERFAIYGATGNLITYLTDVLDEPIARAAANVNVWSGISALLPLLGAFVADAYLGGFNTILLSSVIYVVALVMLTFSVVVPPAFRHVLFFISLYLVSIAQCGHRPCLQTFGADQFDDSKPEERKAKGTFFNWWYFGACVGASGGMIIVLYVQDNIGWLCGFAIPTVAIVFALVVFLLGRKSYRKCSPSGSPVTQVAQVFVAAYRKRHIHMSRDENGYVDFEDGQHDAVSEVQLKDRNLSRTNHFKYLDRGTVMDEVDVQSKTKNSWRLCSVTQVEEVKLLLRLVPIWLCCLTYTMVFAQVQTFFTKQGSTMDTSITHNFRISPASLQVSTNLAVVLFLPIYDRLFIPMARTFTGLPSGITMLQRIGFGMFLASVEMVVAALVESRRANMAHIYALPNQPNTMVPMSVWWMLPQYVMAGVSTAFTFVGMQELFYDQMPDSMRTLGSATYFLALAFGSFLSSVVISLVEDVTSWTGNKWLLDNLDYAHLDYFYWLLAGLNSLTLIVFVVITKCFVHNKMHGDSAP